ncbi:helix-turn-helix domain-containing protein [Metabacillus herbersteinensis]|uniref:Helix-turn-helix domain-containing protein n=1 Tax=Metabacillus herbersteinensis TaxID=283816 RepID=A0ABV6G8S4_9BACI
MANGLHSSKVASLLGESTYMIKSWESEFPEFLSIQRDSKNSRKYSPENIETLRKIKAMKNNGFDTVTITQLLHSQSGNQVIPRSPNIETSEELKASLEKLVSFIESDEVKNLLKVDTRLTKLEDDLVEKIEGSFQSHIASSTQTHIKINQAEFASIKEKISSLSIVSHQERELYQDEIKQERELAKKHIDSREQRFLAFVKEHQRKQGEQPIEPKSGIGLLKQFMGFAR